MRTPGNAEWLVLWEAGTTRHPVDRALLALAAALPEVPPAALADWPLGRRNHALASLFSRCFGPGLHGSLVCRHCDENLEFNLNAQALAGETMDDVAAGSKVGPAEGQDAWPTSLDVCDRASGPVLVNGRSFRVPSSRDLVLAVATGEAESGAARMASNCLLAGDPPAEWSEDELSAIGEKLAQADPLAEIQVAVCCPGCRQEWQEPLDLVAFLWSEIEARARWMLHTVHTLASAYGWSEADILALSDHRRAIYLELAQA